MSARIEARGFGFRHAGRKAWAVRGLDLVVEPGERVLLLGTSGAGKSTLLAALAGLLDPETSGESEGELTVDGREPRAAREVSALVLQDPESQLVMERAGDDVAFGLENRGTPEGEIWPRVRRALDAVGFRHPPEHNTRMLSGGEQQRLALAGALATGPGLLLLDEPTANLDPAGAALVRAALRAVQRDMTTVLVEHRVADALDLVDRVVVLQPGGGVAADGTPQAVFARHGAALARDGVWVPGQPPAVPRAIVTPGEELLLGTGLRHAYPGRPETLSGVDVTLRAAEAVAVTGPNGSGKTTLARLLAGLTRPQHGQVRATEALAGPAAARPPHAWRARDLVTRIGTVFQTPEHQFLTARVRDELALSPRATPERVAELLDRLRLGRLAEANPYTLSGGEKRRLSVATALAAAPRVLVLDEPTFGQDRRTWEELVAMLAAHREDGGAVCAVTHDTALIDRFAQRVVSTGAAATTATGGAPESAAAVVRR